jgi:hypothetical protein
MRGLRPISFVVPLGLAIALSSASSAQITTIPQTSFAATDTSTVSEFVAFGNAARLSPQLALVAYERGLREQSNQLTGYTAVTVIDAELPDSAQKAEFELRRHYAAPALLEFTPMRSSGDNFVKSNVIVRLLQSEVDHVRRREQSQTAVNSQNYKFNYKGTAQLNGVAAHVFDVKPRQKRVGLFKGRIYVEASSGRLLRAQGRLVKSPSFFIKKIDFVQEYATIDGFTLPTHIHSEAQTRLVGKAIVDVIQRDYQPEIGRVDASVQTAVVMGGTD